MEPMKPTVQSAIKKIFAARESIFPRDQWISLPEGGKYSPNYGRVEYQSQDEAVDVFSKFKLGDILTREYMLRDERVICMGQRLVVVKEYSPIGGIGLRFHNQEQATLSDEERRDYADWMGTILFIYPDRWSKWSVVKL